MSDISIGCSWYTISDGSGYFWHGGKYRNAPIGFDNIGLGNIRAAPVGFVSGDEVRAAVDRRSGSGNGVARFYRNGKALQTEPLPIAFPEEAVFVVSFAHAGGSIKILSVE